MRFLTGWGQHTRNPANQGLSTVQVNMLIRLLYGRSLKPSGDYVLDARDMTDIGYLLVAIAEQTASNVSLNQVILLSLTFEFRMISLQWSS